LLNEDIARGKRLEEEEIEAEFGPMRRGPDAFGPVRVVVPGPDVRHAGQTYSATVRRTAPKISPNARCPCGSGKKYKRAV